MKNLVICLIFSMNYFYCYSSDFDTAQVVLNAKMNIVSFENGRKNKNDIIQIINSSCHYGFLNSEGFDPDIIFFYIDVLWDSADEFSSLVNTEHYRNFRYIFGLNLINKEIYKLRGFIDNDFLKLYSYLAHFYPQKKLKNTKIFTRYFRVEGLDFTSLHKYYTKITEKDQIYKYIVFPRRVKY